MMMVVGKSHASIQSIPNACQIAIGAASQTPRTSTPVVKQSLVRGKIFLAQMLRQES
jgi:hypothetical protein